jgi:Flp pilus assembly protein protease CpaA
LEDILQATILILGIVLFVVAAYGDIKTLRIPNALVIAVAILGLFRLIVIGDLSLALYTVGASVMLLTVTFLLFWRGLFGGGDAKLIAAAALLVGYHDLIGFLFTMSICGALVSLAVLVTHWRSEKPQLKAKLAVPYGVAIATAGGVTLFLQSSLIG